MKQGMTAFINEMTQSFREMNRNPITNTPAMMAVEALRIRLAEIPNEVLGKALGRMNIKVSCELLNVAVESGLLDEMATAVIGIYTYSMSTFGTPDFFLESMSRFELEIGG